MTVTILRRPRSSIDRTGEYPMMPASSSAQGSPGPRWSSRGLCFGASAVAAGVILGLATLGAMGAASSPVALRAGLELGGFTLTVERRAEGIYLVQVQ